MKKIVCLIICVLFLVALTSCGSKLPKGEASQITLVNKPYSINEVTFEYVNESTVKIIDSNGDISYIPSSSIERIYVK